MNIAISESPHRGVMDQIKDREAMERMVDALEISARNLGRTGQWIIVGKHGTVQTLADRETFILYAVAKSKRKFSAIKTKLTAFGLKVVQDRGEEGSLLLKGLPNRTEAKALRAVLGLKKKPRKIVRSNNHEVSEQQVVRLSS
jgi:hypothetical protein